MVAVSKNYEHRSDLGGEIINRILLDADMVIMAKGCSFEDGLDLGLRVISVSRSNPLDGEPRLMVQCNARTRSKDSRLCTDTRGSLVTYLVTYCI